MIMPAHWDVLSCVWTDMFAAMGDGHCCETCLGAQWSTSQPLPLGKEGCQAFV